MEIPQTIVEKVIPKNTPNLLNTSKQVADGTKPAETLKVEAKAEANVETTPKMESPVVKSDDILKRQVIKIEETPTAETNYREDLDKISDPVVKAISEK